jgi:hypothetical protein
MCAQKPGEPRETKRVTDYVVVALEITECCLFEDGSRSAQCNEIDFREEESAMLCNQQRETDELKRQKARDCCSVLVDQRAGWMGARRGKGSRRQERQRPERVDDELRRISGKLKLNSSTLPSDITLGKEDGGDNDNERKREGRCTEGMMEKRVSRVWKRREEVSGC